MNGHSSRPRPQVHPLAPFVPVRVCAGRYRVHSSPVSQSRHRIEPGVPARYPFPPRRHHCLVIVFLSPSWRGLCVAFVIDAHQVITLFPDLTLAVEEGEPDLAHDFFSTVKVTNYGLGSCLV